MCVIGIGTFNVVQLGCLCPLTPASKVCSVWSTNTFLSSLSCTIVIQTIYHISHCNLLLLSALAYYMVD